jgi:amino acid transporter
VNEAPALHGDIGRFQYLALGFGTMIGSAWVILLGDWLGKAGPGGAILGFLCGGLVMMAIGGCYAELTARLPEAGSEFIYAHRVYGRPMAFVVGWFLVLYLLCVTVFEGLALAWIVEIVFPRWQPAELYRAFGTPISSETLVVGAGGALTIFALNFRGARVAVVSHSLLTYGFLVVAVLILLAMLANGRVSNALPLFATMNGRPWWLGTGSIFAFGAYALNGFQAIPQAIEERSANTSLRVIAYLIVGSIAAAMLFYCFAVLAASVVLPWRTLTSAPLPMATAAAALPHGQAFVTALLIATAVSLFKAWNGIFMMAARLFVAMARLGYIPRAFARLHDRYESPAAALLVIGGLNVGGIFLGKGAIEPITDMCAMMLTLTYVLCSVTVLRMRRQGRASQFQVPGGASLIWLGGIGAAFMAAVALLSPFWEQSGTVPLEWRLLGAWGLIGALVWFFWVRNAPRP